MADRPPEAVFEAAFQCCSVRKRRRRARPRLISNEPRLLLVGLTCQPPFPPTPSNPTEPMHAPTRASAHIHLKHQVEFSPFHARRLAVATAQYFGIIGNGR